MFVISKRKHIIKMPSIISIKEHSNKKWRLLIVDGTFNLDRFYTHTFDIF